MARLRGRPKGVSAKPAARWLHGVLYPPVCPVCLEAAAGPGRGLCQPCERAMPLSPGPWCAGCGGSLDTPLDLCGECLRSPRRWRHATSAFEFGGQLREAVHGFKYRGRLGLTGFFAAAAADCWRQRRPEPPPEVVVPVPLHWYREWRRGYNQTELLAQAFCEQTGLVLRHGLIRHRHTRAQVRLNMAERQRNLQDAFRPRLDVDLAAKRVLLFDDVLTTGSTLDACTLQLLAAGAQTVDVITIARG